MLVSPWLLKSPDIMPCRAQRGVRSRGPWPGLSGFRVSGCGIWGLGLWDLGFRVSGCGI